LPNDIDLVRLETYREAMAVYKLKQLADAEQFLMRSDISPREKIETLYIICESYSEMLDYMYDRVDKIKADYSI
jgi:hypothetical protein